MVSRECNQENYEGCCKNRLFDYRECRSKHIWNDYGRVLPPSPVGSLEDSVEEDSFDLEEGASSHLSLTSPAGVRRPRELSTARVPGSNDTRSEPFLR